MLTHSVMNVFAPPIGITMLCCTGKTSTVGSKAQGGCLTLSLKQNQQDVYNQICYRFHLHPDGVGRRRLTLLVSELDEQRSPRMKTFSISVPSCLPLRITCPMAKKVDNLSDQEVSLIFENGTAGAGTCRRVP